MHTTVLNDLIQFLTSEVSTSKPVSKMQGHGSQCFSLLMNDLITSKKNNIVVAAFKLAKTLKWVVTIYFRWKPKPLLAQ